MRTWAASDARAAAAIAWIDQRRLDYLQDLFLQIGFPALMPSHAPSLLLMGRRALGFLAVRLNG